MSITEFIEEEVHQHAATSQRFITKSANKLIMEASRRKDPDSLYLSLWYEKEICCLFADTNLGKSILAVQIGSEIAIKKTVVYFDFELSDKQFQLRYTDQATGGLHNFPQNFYRSEFCSDNIPLDESFETAVITGIEEAIKEVGAEVAIIDNLTWLCASSEKGDVATRLMQQLKALQKRLDISMLVIAHTPKRPHYRPLGKDDLAGSKRLINFFDSSFAIGESSKDPALRYIKQIKCRFGQFTYDADNVILCQIVKESDYTHFEIIGYDKERNHLVESTDETDNDIKAKVNELREQGLSYRNIAAKLGISLGKVQRVIN